MSYVARPSYEIDFVRDCGADPTGVTNCKPALDVAYILLSSLGTTPPSARNTSVLRVPPGLFRFTQSAGAWNFLNKVSHLEIRGHRNASIFVLDGIGASALLSIVSPATVLIDSISAVGTSKNPLVSDCGGFMSINPQFSVKVRNCTLHEVIADAYLFDVHGNLVEFEDFYETACASRDADAGHINYTGGGTIILDGCIFNDGFPFNNTLSIVPTTHKNHVRVKGPAAAVIMRGGLFDEVCERHMLLDGDTGRINKVEVKGVIANLPTLLVGRRGAGITVIKANEVEVDATNAVFTTRVWQVDLQDVERATLRNLRRNPASTYHDCVVTADVACDRVDVIDPQNFGEEAICSFAKTTTLDASDQGSVDITIPLIAWYHADDATILTWPSRTTDDANKNAASVVGFRPTLTIIGSHNLQAVRFQTGEYMLTGVWAFPLVQPVTAFVSGSQNSGGSNMFMFDALAGHRFGAFGLTALNGYGMITGGTALASGVVATNTPRVYAFEYNGVRSSLYNDDIVANNSGNAGADFATGLTIGNFAGLGATEAGWDLRQIIIVAGVCSPARRQAIENYLARNDLLELTILNPIGTTLPLSQTITASAKTSGAGTVTVDTGYTIDNERSAELLGGFSVTDHVAQLSSESAVNASLRNYAGLVVAGQNVTGNFGDAALITATVVLGVSGGGTLTVTFTPPAAYGNALDWTITLEATRTP